MDAKSRELTVEYLRSILDYSPDTGKFYWKVRRRGTKGIGAEAGRLDSDGYVIICVDYVEYKAHRLAWFYVHGAWPVGQIDHKNRVRSDNRVENLRDATAAGNAYNKGPALKSKTGRVGVGYHKGRIRAYVGPKHLGYFDSIEEASKARDDYVAANHLGER